MVEAIAHAVHGGFDLVPQIEVQALLPGKREFGAATPFKKFDLTSTEELEISLISMEKLNHQEFRPFRVEFASRIDHGFSLVD
jgi:hypothetical protein